MRRIGFLFVLLLPAVASADPLTAEQRARLLAMPLDVLMSDGQVVRSTLGAWMDWGLDPRRIAPAAGYATAEELAALAQPYVVSASFPATTTTQAAPAPGVPARTFRAGPAYHEGHTCDRCGRPEYVQSGPGPRPGTHTHTCRNCGNVWYH